MCGAIRYEVRSAIDAVLHCHCRMCQKAHGAAFGSYGSVLSSDFRITAGVEFLRSHDSSPGVRRTFCTICGSTLTWNNSQGEWSAWTGFALGTLDAPTGTLKQRHAHLESRPSWLSLREDEPS